MPDVGALSADGVIKDAITTDEKDRDLFRGEQLGGSFTAEASPKGGAGGEGMVMDWDRFDKKKYLGGGQDGTREKRGIEFLDKGILDIPYYLARSIGPSEKYKMKEIVKIKDLKTGHLINVDDEWLVFKEIETDRPGGGVYIQTLKYLYFDSLEEDICIEDPLAELRRRFKKNIKNKKDGQ